MLSGWRGSGGLVANDDRETKALISLSLSLLHTHEHFYLLQIQMIFVHIFSKFSLKLMARESQGFNCNNMMYIRDILENIVKIRDKCK